MAHERRVLTWLKANGISQVDAPANHLYVEAHAPAAAVNALLGITLTRYQAKDRSFYAPDRLPTLPAEIAGSVQWIMGLSDAVRVRAMPNGTPNTNSPYHPQDLANAYNINPLWDAGHTGTGQKVAITFWTDPPSDTTLNRWASDTGAAFHTQANGRLVVTPINGGSACSDAGEAGLDIAAVNGMAYTAQIGYYEVPVIGTCSDGGDTPSLAKPSTAPR